MQNLRSMVDGKILAYGTSSGVQKAWDERGRGRAAVSGLDRKKFAARKLGFGRKMNVNPAEAKAWKKKYDSMGGKLEGLHGKLHHEEEVKGVAGKFLHLLKELGDWHEAWRGFKDLILEAAAGVFVALKAAPYAMAGLANTLLWAHAHIAPAANHIAHITSVMMGSVEAVKQTSPGHHGTMAAMADKKSLVEI